MPDITLPTAHAASIAFVLRGAIRNLGELTVTMRREADPALFDCLLDSMSDEDVLGYIGGMKPVAVAPSPVAPTPEPEPTPEPRERASLIAEWVTAGQDAYRRGVVRDALTGGKRTLPHMQAGWDHAKAEEEARLAVPEITPETLIDGELA